MKTKKLILKNTFSTGNHGWGNGYVAVPPEHPLYGKSYMDEDYPDFNVHGGITFTEPAVYNETTFVSKTKIREKYIGKRAYQLQYGISLDGEIPDNWWLIGFDTCHSNDTNLNWPKERVINETNYLQKRINNLFNKNEQY